MRLYAGKIDAIAAEVINRLTTDGDLEVSDPHEAQLDVASVLKEYIRVDRELTDKAKDLVEQRGLPYGEFTKIKRRLAEEKEFALGEEALNWICTQLQETFMHSPHVAEVFADDADLVKAFRKALGG